jgi:diadenosine tetraphosphatase ApaH/serine/threonine PP2A family protein phosphatase
LINSSFALEDVILRLLVLSDIHANLEALEACLDAAPEYDQVYNLGDIVGYGADPNEVTERSRQLGAVFVRGNHDKACAGLIDLEGFNPIAGMAALWTRQTLAPGHLEFLQQLPQGPLAPMNNVQLVHGSPRDEDEYILMASDAYILLAQATAPLTFFGHTHVQRCFLLESGSGPGKSLVPAHKSGKGKQSVKLELKPGVRYMVNPGSIGQPRDNDPRAAFLLYDTDQNSITFYRVPYDIERAQEKIAAAGLPERLAARLAEGR